LHRNNRRPGVASDGAARPAVPSSFYAAILECGQSYAPARQASLHDFAFSVGGVLIGSALVCMAPMLVEARKSPGTLIAQLQPDIRWLSSPSGSDKTKPDKNSRVPCLNH